MTLRHITFEHLLYTAALGLALFVRLLNLGAAPLSDSEASWALQALEVARGSLTGIALGPQPAYVLLTGLLFSMLGASEGLARLLPALAGSALVLAPVLFRRQLGRPAALILAFGLALDPGMAAVARQAGGPILAVSFTVLALGWWFSRRPVLAGVFAGLALLSGPAVLLGAAGLALAWLIGRLLLGPRRLPGMGVPLEGPPLQQGLVSTGATILLAGSLLLLAPQGLAAWANTIPQFVQGWTRGGGVLPMSVLAALPVFAPLALIFAAVGAVRAMTALGTQPKAREDDETQEDQTSTTSAGHPAPLGLALLVWAVVALLLILLYPARQVADLAWVLVPLWALAALELAHYFPRSQYNAISLGQALVILVLFGLARLNLATMANPLTNPTDFNLRGVVLIGLLLLLVVTSLLIALGWSARAGVQGLVWGLAAGLLFYTLAALWGAAHLRQSSPLEWWSPAPGPGQALLLRQTLRDMALLQSGKPDYIQTALAVDSPALRWELRDYPRLQIVRSPDEATDPVLIITGSDAQTPTLEAGYRGQEFVWRVYPGWQGALPHNFINWWLRRGSPLAEEKIILWVREDIFPGPGVIEPEP